jgi:hypothetical protein
MTQNPYEAQKRDEHLPEATSSKYGPLRKTINLGCGLLVLAVCAPWSIYGLFTLLGSWNDLSQFEQQTTLGWTILFTVTGIGVGYSVWRVWRS